MSIVSFRYIECVTPRVYMTLGKGDIQSPCQFGINSKLLPFFSFGGGVIYEDV